MMDSIKIRPSTIPFPDRFPVGKRFWDFSVEYLKIDKNNEKPDSIWRFMCNHAEEYETDEVDGKIYVWLAPGFRLTAQLLRAYGILGNVYIPYEMIQRYEKNRTTWHEKYTLMEERGGCVGHMGVTKHTYTVGVQLAPIYGLVQKKVADKANIRVVPVQTDATLSKNDKAK